MKMKMSPSSGVSRRYNLAIIGRGMIGSAAARHAAKMLMSSRREQTGKIVLVGPSEPEPLDDPLASGASSNAGIYGAHHDEGRICRRTDKDVIWAELASRSIARYGEISSDSGGMEFYHEVGHLAVGPPDGDAIRKRLTIAGSMGVECEILEEAAVRREYPNLAFPRGCMALRESRHAGYISARGLVAAQTAAARRLGVEIVDDVVNIVYRGDGGCFLLDVGPEHRIIEAEKVLVAAGSFCNARPLLPKRLLVTPIKSQTVHFVLSESDAVSLEGMPSIIVRNNELWAYILPPIRYPDGTLRLKLGGSYLDSDGKERSKDRSISSDRELISWYNGLGDEGASRDMVKMLRSFVPFVEPKLVLGNTCATLDTRTGQAYIGEIEEGWAVATGGCGLAAKSSDELGRLAATSILNNRSFSQERIRGRSCAELFRPRYEGGKNEQNANPNGWQGLRKRATNIALNAKHELTTKREAGVLTKAVSDLIDRIESDGEIIERMVVVRKPIQDYVSQLMQIVSIGKYKEVIALSPYDKMFHLSLLINGRYQLEKNEVVTLSDAGPSIGKGSDFMAVKIPPSSPPLGFTLLLYRTIRFMGPETFSDYCAVKNNCQDFITAVLRSNSLSNHLLESFIKQDAESIFNKLPIHTKTVAKALTDIAAVGDKVVEDIRVKHEETDYLKVMGKMGEKGLQALARVGNTRSGGDDATRNRGLAEDNESIRHGRRAAVLRAGKKMWKHSQGAMKSS